MRMMMAFLVGINLLVSCTLRTNYEGKSKDSVIVGNQSITTDNIWEQIDKKGESFKIDTKLFLTTDSISPDFVEFYGKFISNPEYQLEHIEFPVLAAIGECDTTIQLNQSNWRIYNHDFRKDFYNPLDSNVVYQNESKFYYQKFRKEIGPVLTIGFEKRNGRWMLTLYNVNAC